MIRITGNHDHDRPDCLITMTGIRRGVRDALIVLWEASDRVRGKRLRSLVPVLAEAMERHGHLQLVPQGARVCWR
jgi:hypothetical protein